VQSDWRYSPSPRGTQGCPNGFTFDQARFVLDMMRKGAGKESALSVWQETEPCGTS
jgi:hypothetical protein